MGETDEDGSAVQETIIADTTMSHSDEVAQQMKDTGAGDERLAYRGVFQRILTRPEIGAGIGAFAIWVFFWAVSVPFGKASGASSILDVASAPLGIMAVAVALLMIGGEFDLSSGAATGALAIVTILLVRDVTGMMPGGGLSLWLALPISLAAALGLGWFNGTVVDRTGLPSFIVTLGSFFVLLGAKLGFSKLIIGQQQVGKLDDLQAQAIYIDGNELVVFDTDNVVEMTLADGTELINVPPDILTQIELNIEQGLEAFEGLGGQDVTSITRPEGVEVFTVPPPTVDLIETNIADGLEPLTGVSDDLINIGDRGYAFMADVFSAEWLRNEHIWNSRDWLYIGGIVGGLAICALAIYEMNFRRRDTPNAAGLPVFGAGIAATLFGIWQLHNTDSVGANTIAALIIAAGMTVGFLGWGFWRYQGRGGVDDALGSMASSAADLAEGGLKRVVVPLIAGATSLVLSVLVALWLNPDNDFDLWPTTAEKSAALEEAEAAAESAGETLDIITVAGGTVAVLAIVVGIVTAVLSQLSNLRKESLSSVVKAHGIAAVAAGVIGFLFTYMFMFLATEQGARAIGFLLFSGAAIVGLLIAVNRGRRHSNALGSALLMATALLVVLMAFFIRSESGTPKFRTQAFSMMLAIAAVMAVWSIATLMFEQRQSFDPAADRFGNRLMIAGGAAVVIGLASRLLWITQAELDAGIPPVKFSVRILWFLLFTVVCSWVLARTKFGSWTFAVGGNKQAARQVGVPAARTKTQLFMIVSFAAWLVGLLLAFRLNNIQANTGDGQEFEFIIAAVVGGTLLTGGYGSTIGAAIGAFIMAMSLQGIPSARWNSDWRFVFLGAILLLAVIANNFIREKAEAAR